MNWINIPIASNIPSVENFGVFSNLKNFYALNNLQFFDALRNSNLHSEKQHFSDPRKKVENRMLIQLITLRIFEKY